MKTLQEGSTTQYLFFILEGEKYATQANCVQEVVDHINITRVPKANPCVRGVTNIRGDLIGVVDPKIRFGIGSVEMGKRTSFIIFNIFNKQSQKTIPIALMVDMVIEVEDIGQENILDTPEFGTKIDQKYIENILRYNDEYISVLNTSSVLNIEELSQIA